MLELIGEQLTGELAPSFVNEHTERGHFLEEDVRAMFSFDYLEPVRQVGFVRRTFGKHHIGCSPDALIGTDGMMEIKTKLPHLQLAVLVANKLPTEHVAQCQGALWVAGRKWIDFISYWPGLPPFKTRVLPDPEYVGMLELEIQNFLLEMEAIKAALPPMPNLRMPKRVAQIDVSTEFKSLES